MTDYRKLCIDIFGTDNEEQIKKMTNKKSGRKKTLTDEDTKTAMEMQKKGITTENIAKHFNVSRQTISKALNPPLTGSFVLKLDFMYKQKICTSIYVDYENKKIKIINRTDDIIKRAFGVNEKPTFEDYEDFLKDRCFPETRANKDELLKIIGINSYDPLEIVRYNKGRCPDDSMHIRFTNRKRVEF